MNTEKRLGRLLYHRYLTFCQQFTLRALFLFITLFVITTYYSLQHKLDTNLTNLLPSHYTSLQTLDDLNQRIGEFRSLKIILRGESFNQLTSFAEEISNELSSYPAIKHINYMKKHRFFYENQLLLFPIDELEYIKNRVRSYNFRLKVKEHNKAEILAGLIADIDTLEGFNQETANNKYFTNANNNIFAIDVYSQEPLSDIAKARDFYRFVDGVVKSFMDTSSHQDIHLSYGGLIKDEIDEFNTIGEDLANSALIGFILITLLLFLTYRHPTPVIIIVLSVLFMLSMTFALAFIFVENLSILSALLFLLLFSISVDFFIHFLATYFDFRKSGLPYPQALRDTFVTKSKALQLAGLTTGLVFLGMVSSELLGYKELGKIAAIGTLVTYFTCVLFLPLMIILSEKKAWIKVPKLKKFSMQFGDGWSSKHKVTYGLVIITFIISCTFTLDGIRFNHDLSNLRANIADKLNTQAIIDELSEESNNPAVLIVDDNADVPLIEQAISRKQKKDKTPTIAKYKSIHSVLPYDQEKRMTLLKEMAFELKNLQKLATNDTQIEKIESLIREIESSTFITLDNIPEELLKLFYDNQSGDYNVIYIYNYPSLKPGNNGRDAINFSNDVKSIELSNDKSYPAASPATVYADLINLFLIDGERLIVLAFMIQIIVVLLVSKSYLITLFVTLHIIFASLITSALMSLFGIELNLFNVLAMVTFFGLCTDTAIYLSSQVEFGSQQNKSTTHMAITLSLLTTAASFFALSLSNHGGFSSLGQLGTVSILSILATSWMLAPIIDATYKRDLTKIKTNYYTSKNYIH